MSSQNVVTLQAGGKLAAINPQTFEDVQRLARMAVKAGLSPRDKKDDDETAIAKATMAIMQGLECDIPPMQAVQGIAIINGKAMMYGDLLTALLWSKGFKIEKWTTGEGDDRVGHARITRPDGRVIEKSFSVAQAKQARLWDTREKVKKQWNGNWEEKLNDSPWFRFPDRMLEWRPFGYCVKDGASDATHGMLVTEEAAPDFNQMVDVTPATSGNECFSLSDLPDIADLPEISDGGQDTPDEPISDVEGFLAKLEEERGYCDSEDDVRELADTNADIINRLPDDAKARAADILRIEE
jgi:hypothetical protein